MNLTIDQIDLYNNHFIVSPIQAHFMLTYPKLTYAEQANLPKLLAAPIAITSKFNDSTHHVWHCKTVEGEMVLKVCNPTTILSQHFGWGLTIYLGLTFPIALVTFNIRMIFYKKMAR